MKQIKTKFFIPHQKLPRADNFCNHTRNFFHAAKFDLLADGANLQTTSSVPCHQCAWLITPQFALMSSSSNGPLLPAQGSEK
jgi:hypothetical protein